MKAKIWNNSGWIEETDPKKLKDVFNQRLLAAWFGVINFVEHHFEPFGYSALWLLSESHFALHTFPEEQTTYYEISSCINKPFKHFNTELTVK